MLTPLTPLVPTMPMQSGDESFANVCFVFGNDGTWYGYDSAALFGSADPTHLVDGTLMHSFKFKSDGTFVMQFGDGGDERLSGVDNYYIVSDDANYLGVFDWNPTENYYDGFDETAAAYLIAQPDQCIGFYGLPDTHIHLVMGLMETQT